MALALALAAFPLAGAGEVCTSTIDVRDHGAVGDGITDDHAAFQAATLAPIPCPRRVLVVPAGEAPYVIGDARAALTSIVPPPSTGWRSNGATLVHRANNKFGQNYLLDLEDVEDVSVSGFMIDGEEQTRVGVSMAGRVDRVRLRDLWLRDLRNFAIKYGHIDTDADAASFTDVALVRITVDGKVGKVGDGSGINIFSRGQAESQPTSQGLVIADSTIDVSQGEASPQRHGPQAIKLNNLNDARITNVRTIGGAIAGVIVTNGSRNVRLENLEALDGNRGIRISSGNNANTTLTQSITVTGLTYSAQGALRPLRRGIDIIGAPVNVTIAGADVEGHVYISAILQVRLSVTGAQGVIERDQEVTGATSGASGIVRGAFGGVLVVSPDAAPFVTGERISSATGSATIGSIRDMDALSGLRLEDVTLHGGDLVVEHPPGLVADVTRLSVSNLRLHGNGIAGRLLLGGPNRLVSLSDFRGIVSNGVRDTLIANHGNANVFAGVVSVDGNPDRHAGAALLVDSGRKTTFRDARIEGDHGIDFFVRKLRGSGLTVQRLAGAPRVTDGIEIRNQKALPAGDVTATSQTVQLSGPGAQQVLWTAPEDSYLLGVEVRYIQASSADPGSLVAIGTMSEPARYLGYTSEPALPATTVRIFTNSGVLPRRKLARGEAIVVTSTGGKTGAGQVRITAVLATAPETAPGAVSGHAERVTTAHPALAPSDGDVATSAPLSPPGGYVTSYLDLDFEPTAMSRNGDIVGVRRDDKLNKVMDGVHYRNGVATVIGVLPGTVSSQPLAVNALGQVAGLALGPGRHDKAPFIWDLAGGMRALPLPAGAAAGSITGINEAGVVSGYAIHGQVWDASAVARTVNGQPKAVNDAGEATGVSASQPFLWSAAAGLRRLGLLPEATAGLGTAINNHGQIVGAMAGPLWPWRVGFVWDSAQGYRRIGTDTEFCEPLFINDDGVVIGKYRRLLGPDAGGHPTYDTRIFRWIESRGLELLDDLGAPPIAYVVGLSETGEILARLWDRRWARLVPVTVSPPSRL